MTDDEKKQITILRRDGMGYGKIAQKTGVSVNTVKSFCRRNNLTVSTGEKSVCECCGKQIEQTPGQKRKRFCSDSCRNKWWNGHLDLVKRKAVYTFTCPNCGKVFKAYGNSQRKFCCHACYIEYRFGGGRHG